MSSSEKPARLSVAKVTTGSGPSRRMRMGSAI